MDTIRAQIAERKRLLAAGATLEQVDAHWRGGPRPGGYTFHAYVAGEWRGYTRASLLDELMRSRPFLGFVVARRCGVSMTVWEAGAVRVAWAKWWAEHGQSVRLAETLGVEHVRTLRGDTLRDLISAVSPPVCAVGAVVRENPCGQAEA